MTGASLPQPLGARVEAALGARVEGAVALGGGQVGSVLRCSLADGPQVVVKTSPGTPLEVEAFMLRYLRSHTSLPVPEVLHAEPDLLVEAYVEGSPALTAEAERHAGRLLAELHGVRSERFGLERDTLIGPFRLDNAWSGSWPAFYAERRLLPMARIARDRGHLPASDLTRVERLAASLLERLPEAPAPSLIHGDVWSGNVLVAGGRVAAFLDPAIHYADAEVELAFIDLFHTFGEAFHRAYEAVRPIDPGYRRGRRDLYQVFPLLVHVALFGPPYLGALRERLHRLG